MKRSWILLAALAAVAVLSSACGASGDEEGSESEGDTTETTAKADNASAKFGSMESPCGPGELTVKDGEAGKGTDKLYIGVANDRGAPGPARPQQGAVGRLGVLLGVVQRPGRHRRAPHRAGRPGRAAVPGRGGHDQGLHRRLRHGRRCVHPGQPGVHRQGRLRLPQVQDDRHPGLRRLGGEGPVQRTGAAPAQPPRQEVRAVDHGLPEAVPGGVPEERGRLRRPPVARSGEEAVRRRGPGGRRHRAAPGPELPRGRPHRLDPAGPEGDRERCHLPVLDR